MKARPPSKPPTIVAVIFDQKKSGKAKLLQDASSVMRYIARLQALPGSYSRPEPKVDYVLRDAAVVACAASGFNTSTLSGMARELEVDAIAADKRIYPVLVHGAISIKAAPDELDRSPEEFLAIGHRLMELLGVDANRYILAVHADSDHLHLHFLYSRVGIEGALRERERKLPKFMAEEACAVLAHEFDFGLEPRHLSRVVPGGVVDLASGQMTRNATFDAIPKGSIARSASRMSMYGNDLRKIALVSLHIADGNLGRFRSELAEHGISYKPVGSGSHFEDVHGNSIPASDVDPRLRLGKIKLVGVAQGLPPVPADILERVEQRRRELIALEVPKSDPAEEWQRYTRDRIGVMPLEQFRPQAAWCDDDMKRAFREDKRGRPKKRDAAVKWPDDTHAAGSLGSPSFLLSTIRFDAAIYKTINQKWQSEIWKAGSLVATVRFNRMEVYSKDKVDYRAALVAAHKAWGIVEVFGDQRFKTEMVKLAAELGIALSNPELQSPLAEARLRNSLDMIETNALPTAPVESLGAIDDLVHVPQAARGTAGKTATAVTQSVMDSDDTVPPVDRFAGTVAMSAIDQIDRARTPLVATFETHERIVLLEPAQAAHFRMSEDDQRHPEAQRQLQILYNRQQQEQDQIFDAIDAGDAKIVRSKDPYRETISFKVITNALNLAELVRLHAMNKRFQRKLEDRYKTRGHTQNEGRPTMPTSADQSDNERDILGPPIAVGTDHDDGKAAVAGYAKILARLLADGPVEQLSPVQKTNRWQEADRGAGHAKAHEADRSTVEAPLSPASEDDGQPSPAPAPAPAPGRSHAGTAQPAPIGEATNVLKEKTPIGPEVRNPEAEKPPGLTQVDRLISSFMAAENPAELRKAAVAIRAFKPAKDRMDAMRNRRWLAENLSIEEEQRAMSQSVSNNRS